MATTRDIAVRAGVSQSTVSRVLNHHPYIADDLRARVLAAMEELNYRPNSVTRGLKTLTSRIVGLLVQDVTNPFWAETMGAIADACAGAGYQVLMCHTGRDPAVLARYLDTLLNQRVDGILVGSVHHGDQRMAGLIESDFPCVFYNRRPDIESAHYVVVDNHGGARTAVQHLHRLGHRTIAYLSGWLQASTFAERLTGYRETCQALGLPCHERLVLQAEGGDHLEKDALAELLNRPDRPTAIFAGNDRLALQALDQAHRLGLRVPEDLAVVGFDGTDVGGLAPIGLTTISQQKEMMARLAVETLMALIEKRQAGQLMDPCQIVLEPRLVVRRTCGARLQGQDQTVNV